MPSPKRTTSKRSKDRRDSASSTGVILYAAAEVARLARIRKQRLLQYHERGLLHAIEERDGEFYFDDEAIFLARRIEVMRTEEGASLRSIEVMVGLLRRVRRLEAEVKFLRGH